MHHRMWLEPNHTGLGVEGLEVQDRHADIAAAINDGRRRHPQRHIVDAVDKDLAVEVEQAAQAEVADPPAQHIELAGLLAALGQGGQSEVGVGRPQVQPAGPVARWLIGDALPVAQQVDCGVSHALASLCEGDSPASAVPGPDTSSAAWTGKSAGPGTRGVACSRAGARPCRSGS